MLQSISWRIILKTELMAMLTCEGVTQINLVSERVAQLHPYKLFIPRPFDILFALTFWVRVWIKGSFSPDGISSCCIRKAHGLSLVFDFRSWRVVLKAFKKPVCQVHCQPADSWFSPVLNIGAKNIGVNPQLNFHQWWGKSWSSMCQSWLASAVLNVEQHPFRSKFRFLFLQHIIQFKQLL